MRLAVSNIAWPANADRHAANLLREQQVSGLEIAPTKVWPRPLNATAAEISAYRQEWERRGIQIVALQALLFEKPHFRVFGTPQQRQECLEYLYGVIRLAARLGAHVLVFGSPKNRAAGDLPPAVVREIAVTFFRSLGEQAQQNGVVFCIEPNPIAYGCDFVTTVSAGVELVREVDHPGFALHLDAAGMHLNGESLLDSLAIATTHCRHFHVSEPFLAPVGTGGVPHAELGSALRQAGYDRWLSIEMKCPGDDWAEAVQRAISHTCTAYAHVLACHARPLR
ncbi:MAG: sugar phosphate isomerase/epimerase [Planctomycetes bacterium]|nr:sugar phosphate isomerase/epimerase [Planctomycetota bacterium]